MDKDRVEGTIKKVLGSIQESFGRAIGDRAMEAQGKAKKAEGAAQNITGRVREATREIDGQQ
jgi:uncharacterized protein YjbJ (UPF0337 family)